MVIEYIVFILFIISFAGAAAILARKIPVLNNLPQNGTTGIKKHQYILDVEHRIKNIFIAFEKQIYLHKILSWVKVMTLKLETKVDRSLRKIRQKNKPV